MGTQETIELQNKIKELIKSLGWSQNDLAKILFCEFNDERDDEDKEIEKFQEIFKKELQRETTPSERLQEYLSVITRHSDFKKIGLTLNQYIPSGELNSSLIKEMARISKEIDRKLY
jgi:hypothetical protein